MQIVLKLPIVLIINSAIGKFFNEIIEIYIFKFSLINILNYRTVKRFTLMLLIELSVYKLPRYSLKSIWSLLLSY